MKYFGERDDAKRCEFMNHDTSKLLPALTFMMAIWAATLSAATSALENLNVMALGPLDGRAVIKTADDKMHVLKLGDTIPGTQAVIQQVLNDRVVVEETVEGQGASAKKQIVWIYKPTKAGEKSRIQRLDPQGPPKPVIQKPVVKLVNPGEQKK